MAGWWMWMCYGKRRMIGDVLVAVLETGLSSRRTLVVSGLITLDALVDRIRNDEALATLTRTLRDIRTASGRSPDSPYAKAKRQLPSIIPASQAPVNTPIKGMDPNEWANGLYGFDIDEHREQLDLPAVRESLIASPGAVLVGHSAGGDALYVIYAGPVASSLKEYEQHWNAIAAAMPAEAMAASGGQSKNFNRLRFIAHDPDAWLADTVEPLSGAPPTSAGGEEKAVFTAPADRIGPRDLARIALAKISPPTEYNEWLGWVCTLKSLDFAIEDVEAWSSQGDGYHPGEVAQRWDNLPTDSWDEAHRRLWNGWGLWYQMALWLRPKLADRYRFSADSTARIWWHYHGHVWHPLLRDNQQMKDELSIQRLHFANELELGGYGPLADQFRKDVAWDKAKGEDSDLWAALRDVLRGATPEPASYHLGVPSGVVDLRTGVLHPHDSKYGIRGLTRGDYRPADGAAHLQALAKRLGKVFSGETQNAYLKLVALAMTGRAQSYRALVMILGPSGSGKGDACNIALNALGSRGRGVSQGWLQNERPSDIDAITTDILESQPAIVKLDEVGGDTKLAISRLLSMTGNAPTSARKPHGPLITGSHHFQLWTTAVDPPQIPRHSGIARRLAVLPTLRSLLPDEIDEPGAEAPELLNAVVTIAIRYAAEVYQNGYRAPDGDPIAKQSAVADMDELGEWLSERDDLDGWTIADAVVQARNDLGLSDRALSPRVFGRSVASSDKWDRHKGTGGRRELRRKPKPEEYLIPPE